MKKRIIAASMMALTLVAGLTSCSSDGDIVYTPVSLAVEVPMGIDDVQFSNGLVTLTNVNTNEVFTTSQVTIEDGKLNVNLEEIPIGTYNVKIEGNLAFVKDGVAGNTKVDQTIENVSITSNDNTIKASINTFTANGGFVISEIFFTGTTTAEGEQYSNDQYFIISNNSDVTLYADSVAIVESLFLTTTKYDYTPDVMNDSMSVDAIYMIPGDGKSVPVEPGKSLVIALNGKDHREANPQSFDLSGADFEFYDVSTNSYKDEDNESVPNLDKWYCYTASLFSLHNRGYKAYAIAKMKTDKQTYLDKNYYTPGYNMVIAGKSYGRTSKGYKLANSWILDAVNLSVESKYEWQVTSTALDAGWAHCGSIDMDKTRYNKAVVRKTQDGKWIDTNNSTNDFESDAQPSLLK